MTDRLGAFVVAESGADFTCEIANLTPRTLFLLTDHPLSFRDKVSVTFFSVEVRGEIALCSDSPRGEAPASIQRRIASHMANARTVSRPTIGEAFPPILDEAPATEVVQVEMELIHGLTSHAAQRPSSAVLPVAVRPPPAQTVAARPTRERDAQQAKLDNVVIPPQRKRRNRDRKTTDLDPTPMLIDA